MTPGISITGVGMISAAGHDPRTTLAAFHDARRPPLSRANLSTKIDCPVFTVDDAAAELEPLPEPYTRSRTLTLAMHAVRQALADAGLSDTASKTAPPISPLRIGVCVGTSVACQLNSVSFYKAFREHGKPPIEPLIDYYHANLGQAISDLIGAQGPHTTVVNACSSGADAIGIAAQWINAGLCDIAIAGGADELHEVPMAGFYSLGVMSDEPCMPFDANRTGLNLGEGAGMVVLESHEHAKARGKRAAFELAGFGAACDAHHLTAPHPEARGLIAAIHLALNQANLSPSDIAFINAHGTATPDNDRVESKAIAELFGSDMPFVSTKGYTGHTLGAAGGLETVFCVLGLQEQWLPASAGFTKKDDELPVAPVTQRTVIAGDYALSTSLAFGGNNAAVIVRRLSHA